jgi:diaminopimelate epimerase
LHKKGLVDNEVLIRCLGGNLNIQISKDWEVRMTGQVRQICQGVLNKELLEEFEKD